jgi:hypothetical protein
MTLVLGAEEAQQIVMGADSVAGDADELYSYPGLEKIFERGPYLVGCCGFARVGQVLQHLVEWPDPPTKGELMPFLVHELVPEIRRAVEDAGAATEGRSFLGEKTVLLIGLQGQLWCMGSDLLVIRTHGVACIGSGRHRAYPTMHALQAAGVEPAQKRIAMTLEATAAYTARVGPPFRFLVGARKGG